MYSDDQHQHKLTTNIHTHHIQLLSFLLDGQDAAEKGVVTMVTNYKCQPAGKQIKSSYVSEPHVCLSSQKTRLQSAWDSENRTANTHTEIHNIRFSTQIPNLMLNPPIYECKNENRNLECNIKAFVKMHVKSHMQNKLVWTMLLLTKAHIYISSHLFQ